jgi:hypothetical protein
MLSPYRHTLGRKARPMKCIETKADALEAANAALDLIRAIQSSGINFDDDAIDVSFASARADLEFVCHSWAKPSPEGCSHHKNEDGSRYCRDCGAPLPPHTEKNK